MAESVQEVKARLSIEKDGEPAAFSETADAVDSLGQSASSVGGPVEQLASQLRALADSSVDLGSVAEQAIRDFSDAISEAASAGDLETQQAALERATQALRTYGEEAEKTGEVSGSALAELKVTIEALEEATSRLADPIKASAHDAETAIKELKDAIEKGFAGLSDSRQVGLARKAIDDYRKAIELAKASGKEVTGDQVAQLKRLESEYEKATKEVGDFRRAQTQAKGDIDAARGATEQQIGSIGSLGDVLETTAPKYVPFIRGAAGVVGSFTAGWAAGEKLRGILNQITDGGFDRFVVKAFAVEAAADVIAGGLQGIADAGESTTIQLHKTAEELELLANQRHLFEQLGLGGLSEDVNRNAQIIEKHALAVRADTDALETYLKKVGLSKDELDKQSETLAKVIGLFVAQNKELNNLQLSAIFKKDIQEILDAYRKLGLEAPAALLKIAAGFGITSSVIENAAKKIRDGARDILAEILGLSNKTKSELLLNAAAVEKAFSNIKIQGLSIEEFERAREKLRAVVEEFTLAGSKIPESLALIAAQYGVFQNQAGLVELAVKKTAVAVTEAGTGAVDLAHRWFTASSAGRELASTAAAIVAEFSKTRPEDLGFEEWEKAAKRIQLVVDGYTAAGEKIPQAFQKIAAAFGIFQNAAETASNAAKHVGDAADGMATQLDGARKSAKEVGTATTEMGRSLDNQRPAITEHQISIEELMRRYGEAGKKARDAAAGAKEHGDAAASEGQKVAGAAAAVAEGAGGAATATKDIAAASKAVGDAGASLSATGGQVAAAASDIEKAKTATEGVGRAAHGLDLKPVVGEIDSLKRALAGLPPALQTNLVNALKGVAASVQGWETPILQALDRVIGKAAEAKRSLDQVTT